MARFILSRIAWSIGALLLVTIVVFGLVRLTGDPLQVILPDEATAEMYEATAKRLGLDRPLYEQYARYLTGVLQGDLGSSQQTRAPVSVLIAERFPATLQLSLSAIVLMIIVAVPLGLIAGYRRGGAVDSAIRVIALAGQSVPQFWLGILLILVMSVVLGWLPAGGYGTLSHLVLPTLTLAALVCAGMIRIVRSSVLEVLESEYIRVVRAKGMSEANVLFKHGLRNAAIPVLTFGGLMAANLLTGSIVTETVFAWPGLGRLVYDAIVARDFPVVQGVVLVMSAVYIGVNLLIDVAYVYLNPRLR